MICCCVKKNDNSYEIDVRGHSGYDTIGKDIVCSSVSTAMIITINLLERFNFKFDFSSNNKIPMMNLKVTQCDDKYNNIVIILDNLVSCLEDVSKQYNKFLIIKYL